MMNDGATCNGHRFSFELSRIEFLGRLDSGVAEYSARVALYRDGMFIGGTDWNGEGFAAHRPRALFDRDDSAKVYAELTGKVRAALALISVYA
jgi:hypothetical protein